MNSHRFSDLSTLSISDWFAHTPKDVLSANFGVPESAFSNIPSNQLYIFQAEVPGSLESQKVQSPYGTIPGLTAVQAIESFKQHLERKAGQSIVAGGQFVGKALPQPTAELNVFTEGATTTLAWLVNFNYAQPERANWVALVDATTGTVLLEYNKIDYDHDPSSVTTATGTGNYGTSRTLNVYHDVDNYYYLADFSKNMSNNQPGHGDIETWDLSDLSLSTPVRSATPSFSNADAVDAHYYTGIVYDFYKNLLGRNSLDGQGMSMVSLTHYRPSTGAKTIVTCLQQY